MNIQNFSLRPYQHDIIDDTIRALGQKKRPLISLPTGGGKTVIIAEISRRAFRAGRRVMVLAHRDELLEQIHDKLQAVGLPSQIMTRTTTHFTGCVVASVQSLRNRIRKHTFPAIDLLITDEAHHAGAKSYRDCYDHHFASNSNALMFGVTATPTRLDGMGLTPMFDTLIQKATISDLIDGGFLVPTKVFASRLDEARFAGIKTIGGDFNQKQLADWAEENIIRAHLVNEYERYANGLQMVVFAASVDLAEQYADMYNSRGIPATNIDGSMDMTIRRERVQAFRRGDIKVLTNCNIVTEGFDLPEIAAVQLCRPTKSLSLYLQMIGRALRPAPNKQHALVLDHAGCTLTHGFAEDEREWTLEPTRKKKESHAIRLDDFEEDQRDLSRKEIKHDLSSELILLDRTQILQQREERMRKMNAFAYPQEVQQLAKLLAIVEEKGWKKDDGSPSYMWAWKTFLSKNKPTPDAIHFMRKQAGYHHGWEKHQRKIHNLE